MVVVMSIKRMVIGYNDFSKNLSCYMAIFKVNSKGQLILKCLFGVFNSSKKQIFDLNQLYDTSGQIILRSFFGRIENTKKIFRN